jgi:hypothetical protein
MGTDIPRLEWLDPQDSGAPPFVLDDPAEKKEWRSYHGIMGGVAQLLNATLTAANDGLKQLNSAADPCVV